MFICDNDKLLDNNNISQIKILSNNNTNLLNKMYPNPNSILHDFNTYYNFYLSCY